MKRWVPWFLMLAISTLAGCCVHSVVKHPDGRMTATDDVIDKTVALVNFVDDDAEEVGPDDDSGHMRAYCAGVWVSDDIIVTAGHCVEDLGRPPVTKEMEIMHEMLGMPLPPWDPTGQPLYYSTHNDVRDEHDRRYRSHHNAKVLAFDGDHDLALVHAESTLTDFPVPGHEVARLAYQVTIGSDLKIVGHPGGLWWSFIRGTVSAIRINILDADQKPLDAVQVSAPVWFGNSGGGAFDDEGRLVGICSFMKRSPNTAFFVHRDHVETLLRRYHVGF